MTKRFFCFLLAVVAFMACVGLWGCRSNRIQYVPYEIRSESARVNSDSTARMLAQFLMSRTTEKEKEEVYVFREREVVVNENGDTVKQKEKEVIDRNHERESEKQVYESRIDSMAKVIAHKDSLLAEKPVYVDVPHEVERDFTAWETVRLWSWWGLLAALVLLAGWNVLRWKRGK